MKPLKFILLISVQLQISCETSHTMEKQFDVLSINLPEDYVIKQIKDTNDAKHWEIVSDSETLYVEYYLYNDTLNSSEYGFDSPNSPSLYDGYLSASPTEKKEYKVSYFMNGQNRGRLVQKEYTAGGYYMEINFKDNCRKKCVFQIIGDKLSKGTMGELTKAIETIKFNCR